MLPHSFVNISNGELLVPGYRFPPFRDCSGLVFLTVILETNIWILFISTITISIITEVSRFDRQFDITAITSIYIISDSMTMMITITFDIKTMVLTGITIFLTTVVTNIMRIKSLKITFLIWDFFLSSWSTWWNSDSLVSFSMMVVIWLMDLWGATVILGIMTTWCGWNHSILHMTYSIVSIITSYDLCNPFRFTEWRIVSIFWSIHWLTIIHYLCFLWLTRLNQFISFWVAAAAVRRFGSWSRSCGWSSSWLFSVIFRW